LILSQLCLTYFEEMQTYRFFSEPVNVNKAGKDIWQNFVDKVDHFIPKSN